MDNEVRNNPLELFNVARKVVNGKVETVIMGPPNFRPGTELPVVKYNFVFAGAGIGDFICYMPAMLYLAQFCPWIDGRIFVPSFMVEIITNMMREFPKWRIAPSEKINELQEANTIYRGPGISFGGRPAGAQLLNGCGAHLVDVGFAYFVNSAPPPEGADQFPTMDFAGRPKPLFVHNAKPVDRYVVFTTGGVTPVRTVPGTFWNPVIAHVRDLGLTPVFLGKREIVKGLTVSFPDGCDYDLGVDMRDKTTLMEAAWIMKNAECVLGLDNGLLHLAACTDANIIAGYNIVHPKERRPKRAAGKWAEIFVTKEKLHCANCQSSMKAVPLHSFKHCLYGEEIPSCLRIMFGDDGHQWKSAINSMILDDGIPY